MGSTPVAERIVPRSTGATAALPPQPAGAHRVGEDRDAEGALHLHGDLLGIPRFDFDGDSDHLRHVSWEEWFETFDRRRPNVIYQEERSDGRHYTAFQLESPDREEA